MIESLMSLYLLKDIARGGRIVKNIHFGAISLVNLLPVTQLNFENNKSNHK